MVVDDIVVRMVVDVEVEVIEDVVVVVVEIHSSESLTMEPSKQTYLIILTMVGSTTEQSSDLFFMEPSGHTYLRTISVFLSKLQLLKSETISPFGQI